MDRRDFLALSIATPGLLGSAFADANDTDPLPIIDTHVHLWDLKRFTLPWVTEGSPLARTFTPKNYQEAATGLNVVKGIYMEVDVDSSQQVQEAEWLIDLCRQGETNIVAGVISGRPDEPEFAAYARRFRDNPYVKGIRRVLHSAATPSGTCLRDEFVRGIRLLGELGLTFDLCINPTELTNAAKLIEQCPDTRFILDHCGNPRVHADLTEWRRDIETLAQQDRVVCKVSGFIAHAEKDKWTAEDLAPVINHVREVFGPDRLLFGGDWPVCTLSATLEQWVNALKHVVSTWPDAEQRKLFHDNAVRVYALDK